MMAGAATPLDLQAENQALRLEVAQLREDLMREVALNRKQLADFKNEIYAAIEATNEAVARDRQRINKLESRKVEESEVVTNHIDTIYHWFEEHEGNRKGITYEEAAKLLNVTQERICQLKDAIAIDGRLKVARRTKGNRRMVISLAE